MAAAQRDQAAFGCRGAALAAFGEVENALLGVERLNRQMAHAERRLGILERSVAYARDRFEAGYTSYLEQLDEVIRLRESQPDNLLALYMALGGGWSAPG